MASTKKTTSLYSDQQRVNPLLKISLTTGDIDGIGLEVSAKALAKIGPKKDVNFVLWRSPRATKKYLNLIDTQFKRVRINSWSDFLKINLTSHQELIDICSSEPPAIWVEQCARACLSGHLQGIATAPLSKLTIQRDAQLSDLGHTQILQRVSKSKSLHMAFIGKNFSVILATGHLPLDKVKESLCRNKLESAFYAANQLRKILPKKKQIKPIAVLGLNPHAGEKGLIGKEECSLHEPLIENLRRQDIPIEGPLVPDAAFFKSQWNKYSVYLANYHDQGLIPFKMAHGPGSGVHISLGLPFVRTSVAHGTAKDLFELDCANSDSMVESIQWAIRLAKQKNQLSEPRF